MKIYYAVATPAGVEYAKYVLSQVVKIFRGRRV